jgi:class 3 adenylate cyclase
MFRGRSGGRSGNMPGMTPGTIGTDQNLTVVFTTLRDFDVLAGSLPPAELASLLDAWYRTMTECVRDYQGTVNSFYDGTVMSFWGAPDPVPDHALRACACALRQVELIRRMNDGRPPEYRLDFGVGISTGLMMLGTTGSRDHLNFTVLGDAVNLGSRLSGMGRAYHDDAHGAGHFSRIIISENTYACVERNVIARELDAVPIRGKVAPRCIYELVDIEDGYDPRKSVPPAARGATSVRRERVMKRDSRRVLKAVLGGRAGRAVLKEIIAHPPDSSVVECEATFLCTDVMGFSSFAERMTAQELLIYFNRYLTVMTDIVRDYQGTIERIIGDAIRCCWGAPVPQPDHALLACKCALKQMEALKALNAMLPPEQVMDIAIGISTGIAAIGFLGPREHPSWMPVGSSVSLSERLVGLSRTYFAPRFGASHFSRIIISEQTYAHVKDNVTARELDNVYLPGTTRSMTIYELVDVAGGYEPPKPSKAKGKILRAEAAAYRRERVAMGKGRGAA